MFQREFELNAQEKKGMFLLGPRRTGKSTFLRATFPHALFIDLLDSKTYRALTAHPEQLEEIVRAAPAGQPIVIDEIQRQPELTNEVQRILFERPNLQFILTGSSARKLKKAGTNLLAGRLSARTFCSLTVNEISSDAKISLSYRDIIAWGGLPPVLLSSSREDELHDYVDLYLREEIQAEAHVRNLSQFTRFLEVAALCTAQTVTFSNVANDAQVSASTVRDYFQLLEDTLVGTLLAPFTKTVKRKAQTSAKFFFFDVGVANILRQVAGLKEGHAAYGPSFENFVYCELRALIAYHRPHARLSFWRSLSKFEVDFVIELPDGVILAIEAKASKRVSDSELKGLRAFREDVPHAECFVLSEEPHRRVTADDITIGPVMLTLAELRTRVTSKGPT